jgi:hypothetical protein
MPDESGDDIITTARVNRCRDSTPLGIGIAISGPRLLRLGVDPVETDGVDVRIEDGRLRLVPTEGDPVISELSPPPGVKERWLDATCDR